jgi:hypothetical protein
VVIEAKQKAKGTRHSNDEWADGIRALLRVCEKRRSYGTLRVEVFDGRVKRTIFERSCVDPTTLVSEDV